MPKDIWQADQRSLGSNQEPSSCSYHLSYSQEHLCSSSSVCFYRSRGKYLDIYLLNAPPCAPLFSTEVSCWDAETLPSVTVYLPTCSLLFPCGRQSMSFFLFFFYLGVSINFLIGSQSHSRLTKTFSSLRKAVTGMSRLIRCSFCISRLL